ncbi:MAG TPA: prepilin-type N-terminal cleavage/methylation domain-containing protein [Verrucomicrobiota bacterium]|nr:prepilin-type N-terminal cleavage/methylation domain-containing protein [Verrucomicrobiota bacterium]
MKLLRNNVAQHSSQAGFTMIELAICLGIIAFALVAIIGVLPVGINVQKDNREETIINQDGQYWMEAIRSGATGLNELTNSIAFIEIQSSDSKLYRWEPLPARAGDSHIELPRGVQGAAIIGLLSMPVQADLVGPVTVKNWPQINNESHRYNRIRAKVRAISGSAVDKGEAAKDMAFSYRLTSEVRPIRTMGDWGNISGDKTALDANRFRKLNFYEIKLTFQWPEYIFGGEERPGPNKKVFRAVAAGRLVNRNLNLLNVPDAATGRFQEDATSPFFFFEPNRFSIPKVARAQ